MHITYYRADDSQSLFGQMSIRRMSIRTDENKAEEYKADEFRADEYKASVVSRRYKASVDEYKASVAELHHCGFGKILRALVCLLC